MPRIVIDSETCLNSGQCGYMTPDIFEIDDDGAPTIKVPEPSGDQMQLVQDAIDMCPSQSISLVD